LHEGDPVRKLPMPLPNSSALRLLALDAFVKVSAMRASQVRGRVVANYFFAAERARWRPLRPLSKASGAELVTARRLGWLRERIEAEWAS